MQGYVFGVVSAFLSAMAAVYTEWVMKRNNDSLYWQNIQLYTFGVAFNALGLVLGDLRAGDVPMSAEITVLMLELDTPSSAVELLPVITMFCRLHSPASDE